MEKMKVEDLYICQHTGEGEERKSTCITTNAFGNCPNNECEE